MLCGISGTVPEEPVFCAKSGQIYERRLAAKHIEQTGREPMTGEEAALADLLPVSAAKLVRPRPVAGGASLGGLLSLLQGEYDAMLLEGFQLRQELESTRQELSQALYQHDAACRVIARLVTERDASRSALAAAHASFAARLSALPAAAASAAAAAGGDEDMSGGGGAGAGAAPGGAASAEAAAAAAAAGAGTDGRLQYGVKDANKELSRARKKRALPADGAGAEQLAGGLALAHTFAHHSASAPGVLALDAAPSAGVALLAGADGVPPSSAVLPAFVLTGGADGAALLLALPPGARDGGAIASGGWVVGRMTGHKAAVTGVAVLATAAATAGDEDAGSSGSVWGRVPTACVSASADGSVRLWASSAASADADDAMAPAGAGSSSSSAWACSAVISAPLGGSVAGGVASLSLHPSLPLAAISGATGWGLLDLASARSVYASAPLSVPAVGGDGDAVFGTGCFHPDGALYALTASDGVVRVYDVRDRSEAAAFLPTPWRADAPAAAPATSGLAFSQNGWLCATGDADGALRIWDLRKGSQVSGLAASATGAPVQALAFDYSGAFLACGDAAGAVAVWGTKEVQATGGAGDGVAPLLRHAGAAGGGGVTALAWGPRARSLLVAARGKAALQVLTLPAA